jgi:uncharacterized protein (DUF1330 family)
MPAYMIFLREEPIRDSAEMAEYGRLNREHAQESITAFQLKPLVVYGALEAVEGRPPDGAIVLEFPSVADAKAWYNSPAYQKALPHRLKAANYRAFIVEGWKP